METMKGVTIVISALILIGVMVGEMDAFNPDRIVHKWSPLYFKSYIRRGNLYKRFRDEPIQKWSPTYFDTPNMYWSQKRDATGCGRENSLCAYMSSTGEPMTVRCCGALQCLYTGASYTCIDPKSIEGPEYDYIPS